jgi:P pilus assembly chaperone PapD
MKHAAIAAALLLLTAPLARAGISISPPGIELKPGQQTAELRVSNDGDAPVSMQASMVRWAQTAEGVDQESDSRDFVLYPKLFTIKPGEPQIVRVGRLPGAPGNGDTEIAYRLSLRELPVDQGNSGSIGVTLRLRLPVWLLPIKAVKDWSLGKLEALPPEQPGGAPGVAVPLRNAGNSRVRTIDFKFQSLDAQGAVLQELSVPGWYALAGATPRYPARLTPEFCRQAAQIRVIARTTDDSRETSAPAAPYCAALR